LSAQEILAGLVAIRRRRNGKAFVSYEDGRAMRREEERLWGEAYRLMEPCADDAPPKPRGRPPKVKPEGEQPAQ
jgi:hypothetical protein